MVRRPLARWLVVGASVLVLGATYWALVAAFRILALPRFEIPYVEPDAGLCGFGHYDPYRWLALAIVALGLNWAPLGWAGARRSLVAKCLAGLAGLTGALGLTWLVVVGCGVRAILGAMRAWRWGGGISHPGFDYLDYERLFGAAQVGLGIMALAVSLLSLCARLHRWRFRAEAVMATRAGLMLLLGTVLSVRSAWLNEAGCFPLWPAFRMDAPESWDGLWTTSLGFYAGCLSLAFVAWPAARRRAWFAVPLALGALYSFQDGSWGPQCTCQAAEVPSVPVATATLSKYPAAPARGFGPSEAAELSARGIAWRGEQFDGVPTFLDAVARNQALRRQLADVLGPSAAPGNLVIRLAPGGSLAQLHHAVAGARAAGFTGITFELGVDPWQVEVGWGLQLPTAPLLRVPVPFADDKGCRLDLGSEGSADAWLRRVETQLTERASCFASEP